MVRRPPITTRPVPLFPYTTLFRPLLAAVLGAFLERLVALDEVEVAQRELRGFGEGHLIVEQHRQRGQVAARLVTDPFADQRQARFGSRSEEHTSELQSLMRISYAVFCLKKKK